MLAECGVAASIDEGGELSTVLFNEHPKDYSYSELAEYAALLRALADAVAAADLATVGGYRCAQRGSESAACRQAKP
jgi:hypothetical protein